MDTIPEFRRMWNEEELRLHVTVNDRPIDGLFDSGGDRAIINWTEAHALGITRASPGVHADSPGGLLMIHFVQGVRDSDSLKAQPGDSTYTVTGLRLRVGNQLLPPDTVMISDLTFQDLGAFREQPMIIVGLQPFRDRVVFFSYSTGTICVGRPIGR